MRSNYERFLYLQRGSKHQLLGGIKKSHACTLAAENHSLEAQPSWAASIRASW